MNEAFDLILPRRAFSAMMKSVGVGEYGSDEQSSDVDVEVNLSITV